MMKSANGRRNEKALWVVDKSVPKNESMVLRKAVEHVRIGELLLSISKSGKMNTDSSVNESDLVS